jgi:glycolate oxidase FAD binding subunit
VSQTNTCFRIKSIVQLESKLPELWGEDIEVRAATGDDGVDGVTAPIVIAPIVAPRTEQVARELVAWCGRENKAFIARGGGTKLHIGARPQRCDLFISTEHLNTVTDHDAGNATICAGAGITLRELSRVVETHNQFLPLEDAPSATLGGLLATNSASGARLKYGTPRDLVVGLNAVLSDGRWVQAGSKVVKNVSGYDLMKIFTGSFGTLGLLTQVTIRLRPQNAASRTWQSTFPTLESAVATAQEMFGGEFEPSLLQIRLEAGVCVVKARFDGGTASVETQWQRLPRAHDLPPQSYAPPVEVLLRAGLPRQQASHWVELAREQGAAQVLWEYGLGEVRAAFSQAGDATRVQHLRRAAEQHGGFMVAERLPEAWKTPELVWGVPRADWPLMQRLKARFDAAHVCAPGRFIGGL